MSIRIGTRGSALALAQTERVCRMLAERDIAVETFVITTEGDTTTGVPLHEIGGQGVFVRALDDAILRGEIDIAVHSMKDIPAARPPGLALGAVLERDSPADFLAYLGQIEDVRTVGSSSTRRCAQILRFDPSVEVKPLRGNVDTRIRKMRERQYDAIILAEAGLERLGYTLPGDRLPVDTFVPSPNQGAIAVVCREDPSLVEMLTFLDHAPTRFDVEAERAVMEEVGGGCFTPQGIYCRDGSLIGEVLALDGSRWERVEQHVETLEEARECGRDLRALAEHLIREAREALGLSS
ncbi:hydroxymethylbilane synthase [Methanoculleus sp. FWC-SCC1]|uniref:Probable porphobilinogen deaminase n=1 Tax=Methanoculleus frigidifontis TaxID=2584085 RepID=A0ABT8M696_9EURY|nr:hydroxymethylbilane synthase [Methanoculleus sp. FWC-SCC1]MDN7023461.1 hydroxymethylbilane synthase [Methanoculleus sp. FWC-SCC1]